MLARHYYSASLRQTSMKSLPVEVLDSHDDEPPRLESIDELLQVPLNEHNPERSIRVSSDLNQEDYATLVETL